MRGLFVSAIATLGVFAFACSPEPAKKAKVVMVGDSVPKDDDSGSKKTGTKTGTDTTADTDLDDSTKPEDTSPTETPDGEEQEPNTPPPTPQAETKSCPASAEGNSSNTTVSYVVQNGSANISSMTVSISNKNHRNKNDVDVYVTPNGGKESFVFNSKDILMDGQSTTVPLPNNFKVTMGSQIRVKTNFDDSWGDPSESCTLQF